MLSEASDEIVTEREDEVTLPEDGRHTEDLSSCPSVPEMNEDTSRKENSCAKDLGSQPPPEMPTLVNISNCTVLKQSSYRTILTNFVSSGVIPY